MAAPNSANRCDLEDRGGRCRSEPGASLCGDFAERADLAALAER